MSPGNTLLDAVYFAVSIDDMLKDRHDALRKQKTEAEHKIDNYSDSPQATMDAIDSNLVKTFCEEVRKKLKSLPRNIFSCW